jgi:hypothetical protein
MDAEVPLTNGTEADGGVVWSRHPDAGVESCGKHPAGWRWLTSPVHRGEHEISRKTIAWGMPDDSGVTC